MLKLEELARQVVDNWESRHLQVHVRALAQHLKQLDADRQQYAAHIQQARDRYANDDLEIDDLPLVSPSAQPGSAFVNAWLWIDLVNT